jgi:hypothetical protein
MGVVRHPAEPRVQTIAGLPQALSIARQHWLSAEAEMSGSLEAFDQAVRAAMRGAV